ncbi:DUF3800 domain-containing protein [Methylobacterium brachiatum]|uniref:DUF3800 domain-containing protein n=1 Tax=Methylobacterium brachiatum TaxID=269660 RepID=UPI0008E3FA16|nr:DUF3800 domain-containing protein [Methylobacterium brachiatum]SFI95439.1 Protein of unknown function [Methylobacterium brachiatum]
MCDSPAPAFPYEYVAYIDEAGDPGLSRVKPNFTNGASEWLIVSAVVVARPRENEVGDWVRSMIGRLKNHQRKSIHFADLNAAKRSFVCADLANRPVRCFVVASNKKNMQGYKNPFAEKISMDVNWFYCWLTRLLLERVTYWVEKQSISKFGEPRKIRLEYSARGGLSYSQLSAYFELLRVKSGDLKLPLGNLHWSSIDRDQVFIYPHEQRAGLQLADIVASAFFKACDVYDTGACDPQFAKLLSPRMARDPDKMSGRVCGFGVKLMPKWNLAKLLPEQQVIFNEYGYPGSQWWDPASSIP